MEMEGLALTKNRSLIDSDRVQDGHGAHGDGGMLKSLGDSASAAHVQLSSRSNQVRLGP
jgi:hypothetical protein